MLFSKKLFDLCFLLFKHFIIWSNVFLNSKTFFLADSSELFVIDGSSTGYVVTWAGKTQGHCQPVYMMIQGHSTTPCMNRQQATIQHKLYKADHKNGSFRRHRIHKSWPIIIVSNSKFSKAVIEGHNKYYLSCLSMLDFPLMLWVKLLLVDRIHPQSNKFSKVVENKATGDSKVNDSPV